MRELTYSSVVSIDITYYEKYNNKIIKEKYYPKVIIARIPMMIGTSKCNLYNKLLKERMVLGECQYDNGGYFIIKGKERVIISQERGNTNHVYVYEQKSNMKYKYVCEIRSTSEENGHSILIQMRLYNITHKITVMLPFFSQEIPLSYIFLIYGYTKDDIFKILNIQLKHFETGNVHLYIQNIVREMEMIQTEENAMKYMSQFLVHSIIKENK
jgi:DNA-directed RNA polymerase beta subunit